MEIAVSWAKTICVDISQGLIPNHVDDIKSETAEQSNKHLSTWSVLDIETSITTTIKCTQPVLVL